LLLPSVITQFSFCLVFYDGGVVFISTDTSKPLAVLQAQRAFKSLVTGCDILAHANLSPHERNALGDTMVSLVYSVPSF
jgi:hypothetical protein